MKPDHDTVVVSPALRPVAGDRAAVDGVAGAGAPLGWEEMLASAEALAEGDEALMGLIEDARVEGTKGVASGPVYNIGQLGNGKGDTYPPIEFRGGEYAEVYVEAKAAVNLNLAIYDDKGRLVVTISQNSVGNAITELLGIVVKRQVDSDAYAAVEEGLVSHLLEARERLRAANLGESLSAPCWPNGAYKACR